MHYWPHVPRGFQFKYDYVTLNTKIKILKIKNWYMHSSHTRAQTQNDSRYSDYATGWMVRCSYRNRKQNISVFSKTSRPVLRPAQPPVQWLPGFLKGAKQPEREANHSPPSSTELYLKSPYMPSWRRKGLYLSTCYFYTHTNWKFDEGFAKLLGGGGHNYIQTGTTAFTSAALIDICIKTSTLFQFTTSWFYPTNDVM